MATAMMGESREKTRERLVRTESVSDSEIESTSFKSRTAGSSPSAEGDAVEAASFRGLPRCHFRGCLVGSGRRVARDRRRRNGRIHIGTF
jgi:hypothetical protein